MGRRVIEALGIGTAATHMEWFFGSGSGPKGLRFSEIGARPPGVGQWEVYCAANGFDLYREWALPVTHHRTEARLRGGERVALPRMPPAIRNSARHKQTGNSGDPARVRGRRPIERRRRAKS